MSKVSLREYIRDINSLIEENHIREAKEHCAYILKSYPKYIDVYRLLGKAHLESRRYDEAEKIFVRVLAVLPDDFISHLGLSVVKEEQENLDSAIWHMERAYELKSTQTIHEELHRLFTLRDGVAPPKPLITRGALIRINVRSGLYQQALKEIDHALKEDPQRLDLEILRAKIYYQQKNIPLAVRYCKMILQKRPYAYDANLLMTEIASTSEQAEPFKQRMFELDPYTSLVDDNLSLDEVPPDSIMIEKLDIPLQEPKNNAQVTDELGDSEVANSALLSSDPTPGFAEPEMDGQEISPPINLVDSTILEANAHENAHIPDWMQEMGWEPGTSRTSEEEQAMIAEYDQIIPESEVVKSPEGLVESEIPDWLKDLQPIEDLPQDEIIEKPEDDEEKIAWLSDILPEQDEEFPAIHETDSSPEGISPNKKSPFSSMPDFGEDLDADQEWLEMVSSPEPKLLDPSEQSTDRPSRMPEPEEVMDFSFEEPEEEEVNESKSPEPQLPDDSNGEDIDSAIAWLEGLAARQGAEEEVLFSDLDARDEKPGWLDEESGDDNDELEEPSYMIDEEIEAIEEANEDTELEFFDSYEDKSIVEETIPAFGSPESIDAEKSEMSDADVPEWLKSIAPPESVDLEDESDQRSMPINESISNESDLKIPQDLDSLFDTNSDMDLVDEDETDEYPQIEYPDEENEPIFSDDEEISMEAPEPSNEQFATTAVLDFIKKEVDDEIDEVDNWLKSLPQHSDEDTLDDVDQVENIVKAEETEDFSDFPMEDASDKVDLSASKEDNSIEFIDNYFTEEIDEPHLEESISKTEESEPYQWEQEYEKLSTEESDLPDWIAGIEEKDFQSSDEPSKQELVSAESESMNDTQDGPAAIPDWMMIDDIPDVEIPSQTEEHPDETLQFEPTNVEFEEIEEEERDTAWMDMLNEDDDELPSEDQLEIEIPVIEEMDDDDFEEMFLIAKNKLFNGDFEEAFPALKFLVEKEHWLKPVMETLIFDIENYHPIEVESWVLLGDAYRKQARLKEALDAYTKAEGFIK